MHLCDAGHVLPLYADTAECKRNGSAELYALRLSQLVCVCDDNKSSTSRSLSLSEKLFSLMQFKLWMYDQGIQCSSVRTIRARLYALRYSLIQSTEGFCVCFFLPLFF